jgi:hypothetical protein
MKWQFVSLLTAAVLLAAGGELLASEDDPVADLRAFIAVPVKDRMESALGAGDLRFLGVYGYAHEVPGVPKSESDRISKNGILPIPGTSDALVSEEHAILNDEAREYASQYNALLLGHVKPRAT